MIQVGLIPLQILASLAQDEHGEWVDIPEGQTVVPLIKNPCNPPPGKTGFPKLTWYADRVERDWTYEIPPLSPVPFAITPRQMRLWLLSKDADGGKKMLHTAISYINQPTDDIERQKQQIAWEFAIQIQRDDPLVASIATLLGLSSAQIDQAFREAILL